MAHEMASRCPLCDEYEGKPESVEAHISAKTDEAHRGEVGRRWRTRIWKGLDTAPAEETGDELAEEASSSRDPETDSEASSSGGSSGGWTLLAGTALLAVVVLAAPPTEQSSTSEESEEIETNGWSG